VPVSVVVDRTALMRAAAERVVSSAAEAIERHGRFDWALSGGSTPEQLYTLLASRELLPRIDWSRVSFFFGDERCVPPDDPQSNYRMALASLLGPLGVPAERVHRMLGELGAEIAAERYQAELERCLAREGNGLPAFDLVLLGMGADGHTASLFPGTAALDERARWVAGSHPDGLVPRVTLTLPLINAARRVLFLVSGADKAQAAREVLHGSSPLPLPAARVRPLAADAEWLLDAAAASSLGSAQ
jgi:6-phosphogluconolactonase